MNKVLIIANLLYASPRIQGLAKYLPEFAWQPIILTAPISEISDFQSGSYSDFRRKKFVSSNDLKKNRVIETYGYSSREDLGLHMKNRLNLTSKKSYEYAKPLLRFLYKCYLEIANYPDEEKGWKPFAVEAGSKLLQNEHIDAMISSSSPVTTHIIAKKLKNKYSIPWVADFRDLWTQNHNYPYTKLRKLFEKRLELKTLSIADALVTVSSPMTEKLQTLHKGKRAYTITNGFDPEKMSNGKTDLTSKFTITYTGQIYKKQDPLKLLIALKDLISERSIDPNDIDVRFYGPENKLLHEKTEEFALSKIVKQHGIISRESSFEKQKESQLLLQINWEDPQERGAYSGKIFEYLAAKRPILATGGFGKDVVETLLDETDSGIYCPTTEDIENTLRELYLKYKLKGKLAYNGKLEKINKYSYREMAKKFAEILDNLA